MCSNHHILMISPSFPNQKWGHSTLVLYSFTIMLDLFQTEIRDIISKALIQPKIIPPFHSNQIAKPMMCKFMRNSISKLKLCFYWYFLLKDILIIMCNNCCILHCSPFIFMSKYLIILIKWIWIAKEFLEEF